MGSFMVTEQPTDNSVVAGQAVGELFSVEAQSDHPISYKWQHSVDGGLTYFDINPNGGVFTGSRSSILGVNANMTDLSSTWNGAKFRCVLESNGYVIVSDPGTLSVAAS
jgi:hypothetical protein